MRVLIGQRWLILTSEAAGGIFATERSFLRTQISMGTETRERIVARAADIFNVIGYAGMAISDIMRVTGLEKGGIYRHFASKDELALAAFDPAAERVRQRFAVGLAGTTNAADTLLAFVSVFRSYAQHPPLEGGCPILTTR
jgi:TetR/AcrR family transcriptional repressor of nem operon